MNVNIAGRFYLSEYFRVVSLCIIYVLLAIYSTNKGLGLLRNQCYINLSYCSAHQKSTTYVSVIVS